MTRIEVPSETIVVEIGKEGLNIVEIFMQMSGMDDSAQVQCDICSKPLGKMKDVKHVSRHESRITNCRICYPIHLGQSYCNMRRQ